MPPARNPENACKASLRYACPPTRDGISTPHSPKPLIKLEPSRYAGTPLQAKLVLHDGPHPLGHLAGHGGRRGAPLPGLALRLGETVTPPAAVALDLIWLQNSQALKDFEGTILVKEGDMPIEPPTCPMKENLPAVIA